MPTISPTANMCSIQLQNVFDMLDWRERAIGYEHRGRLLQFLQVSEDTRWSDKKREYHIVA